MAVYKSKSPTKDGRAYFFRIKYKDILGEVHDYTSPKYKSLKEAENEEARYRIKIDERKVNTSTITIEEAYLEYLEDKKAKVKRQTAEKENHRYSYIKPIAKVKINELDVKKYKKWLEGLNQTTLSAETKNKVVQCLRRIIKYSTKYYNTQNTILEFIEPIKDVNALKKEMDFYTYEEYLQFDSVIDNFEYHTLFEILYFIGLRQGELQALTWNDIDFKKKEIKINKTLTTKLKGEDWTVSTPKTKNSIRTLPMTERVYNDLKTMLNNAKKYSNFEIKWFVFGNSRPFGETRIQDAKNKYCDLAELRRIRIHDFRHSCASLLINQGASIVLVSKYLGHSNVSITLNTYTHLFKNELTQMTEILNNL